MALFSRKVVQILVQGAEFNEGAGRHSSSLEIGC